jgi:putative FmdB family regulatory protein
MEKERGMGKGINFPAPPFYPLHGPLPHGIRSAIGRDPYFSVAMPTYEYECAKCRKTFEVFQSMKDAALTTCPKESCAQRSWGKGTVKRLLGTGAGLIFKGSGFYITDYRTESYKAGAKSDSGTGADAGGVAKESKPKESKPKETKSAGTKTKAAAKAD